MAETTNQCACGSKPLIQDYGGQYQVKCKCGVKSPIYPTPEQAITQWNILCPAGKPTMVDIKGAELLSKYDKLVKDGVVFIRGMDVISNGCYRIYLRWL